MTNSTASANHERRSAHLIANRARLPAGYIVEFSCRPPASLEVRWTPDVPRIRSPRLRRKVFEAYTVARTEFLEMLAASIGGSVGIVDVGGDEATLGVVRPPVRH